MVTPALQYGSHMVTLGYKGKNFEDQINTHLGFQWI